MNAKKCRELGFPLAEAKALLDLSEVGDEDCQSVKQMAELHNSNVRSKINELRCLEFALDELTANATVEIYPVHCFPNCELYMTNNRSWAKYLRRNFLAPLEIS